MRAKLQAIKQELRRRIHQPIPVQGKWLRQVVTGYFNYHAVPTNSLALDAFRFFVTEIWQRTLRRRSQKDGMTWERITRLANDWLVRSVRGALSNERPYREFDRDVVSKKHTERLPYPEVSKERQRGWRQSSTSGR